MSAEPAAGRSATTWIAMGAAVAVLAAGGVVVWWLLASHGQITVPQGNNKQVLVPDVSNKAVEEARRIIADAQLGLREEQREENGPREGLVIAQDPAPSAKLPPGSSVTIVVAVAPKPTVPIDVSGRWDSSTNSRYDVIGSGSDFFFRSVAQGPRPEAVDERGSGSVLESTVTLEWAGDNGKRPISGQVVHSNDKGIAQAIYWNSGMIWFRPIEEGSELVRHYKLDQYSRATILDAVRKEAAGQTHSE